MQIVKCYVNSLLNNLFAMFASDRAMTKYGRDVDTKSVAISMSDCVTGTFLRGGCETWREI